jgi:hypothetical protein
MKRLSCCLLLCGFFVATLSPAHARDDKHHFPIAAVLEGKDGRSKLDGSVKFFFGVALKGDFVKLVEKKIAVYP